MSSLYDLVARNVMTGVVRVLMADMPEPAARDAAMRLIRQRASADEIVFVTPSGTYRNEPQPGMDDDL